MSNRNSQVITLLYIRREVFDSKSQNWKCLPENQIIKLPYGEDLDTKQIASDPGFIFSLTTKKEDFRVQVGERELGILELPHPLCDNDYC